MRIRYGNRTQAVQRKQAVLARRARSRRLEHHAHVRLGAFSGAQHVCVRLIAPVSCIVAAEIGTSMRAPL